MKKITLVHYIIPVMFLAAPVFAGLLVTGTSGSYRTITEALGQAGTGDTVYVLDGNYNSNAGEHFPLSLKKGVTLLGQSVPFTIIDAVGTNKPVLDVDKVTDVTVKSLSIINGKIGIDVKKGSDNFRVEGCLLADNKDRNIKIKDSADPAILGNFILRSKKGIELDNASFALVRNNTVVGLDPAKDTGIKYKETTGIIEANIIDNFGTGIKTDKVTAALVDISGNNIHRCATAYEDKTGKTVYPAYTEKGNTAVDPLFSNPAAGDYSLSPESPCTDLGPDGAGSLPVELASFTGRIRGNTVVLTWQTASETDNLGWNILRGGTGPAMYKKVNARLIPGRGTCNARTVYEYIDKPGKTGRYSYRLEQVDLDGGSTCPAALTLDLYTTGMAEQPADGELQIRWLPGRHVLVTGAAGLRVRVRIADAQGKILVTETFSPDGSGWYRLPGTLLSGIYLVYFYDGKDTVCRQVFLN